MTQLIKEKFNPLVSIIIPVYNGADYLSDAIDSALAQTYANIEIIVVNDGSVDDTEKIAKSYVDKIRYFAKENGGVSSALNVGLHEMKGEYFSWLSHDDTYYPKRIENQVVFITNLENRDVILYSDYEFMDEKSNVIGNRILDHQMLEKKPEYSLLRSSINGNTLLIPKKAFEEYGQFDENLKCSQDYAMWFEMMKTYKFIHIPEILAKYRIHESQDTNKNPKFISEGDSLWIKMAKELPREIKERLEGSEYNYYLEMAKFLEKTPYEKAMEFSHEKARDILRTKQAKCSLVVSFISHSAGMGGAERSLLDIIDDVVTRCGVFAHVVLNGRGPLEQELLKRNVFHEVMEFPMWTNVNSSDAKSVQDSINESAVKLVLKLNAIKPDIVFTNTSVINEGALAAKILGIPHIWNISEFGKEEHGVKYMLDEVERMQFINEYSDKIFLVSNALKNYYKGKVDEDKMVVMPNMVRVKKEDVSINFFHIPGALKLLLIGNIIIGKGQRDAVLAVKDLLERNKNVELVLAGNKANEAYFNELQRIIEDAKLQKNVRFIGYVDNSTELIRQSDVVIVCSTNEGFGRVAVEGMLLRKPVIGANSGATPELVNDGLNGFLYESSNHKQLAKKIEYFIANNEEIEKIGQNGYDSVKKTFNEQKYLEKLFKEIMELKKIKKETVLPLKMIENMVNNIEQKRKELIERDQEIKNLILVAKQKDHEILIMKSSKFWKLRDFYLQIKNKFK